MKDFKIAILGCGTVGGGVARILLDLQSELAGRSSQKILLVKIIELLPKKASDRFGIPMKFFAGGKDKLSISEANRFIDEVIESDNIDLVVETIGGSNDYIEQLAIRILDAGKHLVTANKALLAQRQASEAIAFVRVGTRKIDHQTGLRRRQSATEAVAKRR